MSISAATAPGCVMAAPAQSAAAAPDLAVNAMRDFAIRASRRQRAARCCSAITASKPTKRKKLMRQMAIRRRSRRRAHRRQRFQCPPLRLTPYAWSKLLHLRDLGETEVGGFGVSRPEDLLLVDDVHLVRQECTAVSVKFDDQSV